MHPALLSSSDLVGEVPGSGGAAHGLGIELVEDGGGQINRVALAAHALISDGSGSSLAGRVTLDGDGAATVGVAVGLGSHHAVGKGNDLVGVGGRGTAST